MNEDDRPGSGAVGARGPRPGSSPVVMVRRDWDEEIDGATVPRTVVAALTSRDAVIEARGLTKVYRSGNQRVVALDGVDLDIVHGEVTVILGPSGSGKSTILNLLGGMDRPTSGTIVCAGSTVHDLSDAGLTRYRRDQVGFVFQHYNLIPTLTAAENVGIGSVRPRRARRFGAGRTSEEPMDPQASLAQLGLGDRGGSFPYELSGGQMQRVAIARALAKRPALLLADEPTGALDSRTGVEVMDALVDAARDAAVVVVTHNEAFAEIADQVVVLRDGRVVGG